MKHLIFFTISILLFIQVKAQLQVSPEQLLSEYVQHESITGNEKNAAEYLLNKCKEAGLYIHVFSDEKDSYNFAASLYPLESNKPNIVFHNHCDVVHAGDSSKWTYPPFSGTIADSAVWGRGSIDNKALAVMELMALKNFTDSAKQVDFPYNFTILTVSGEEKAGEQGAAKIVKDHLEILNAEVVFGEGGMGTKNVLQSNPERTVYGISVAHKQAIWLELSLKNDAFGHGAVYTEDNINNQLVKALYKLVKKKRKLKFTSASRQMTIELSKYEKGIIRCVYRHPKLFFPLVKKKILDNPFFSIVFTNTTTLTNIYSSHSSINAISDEVSAILDCRLLEPIDSDEFIKQIRKKIKSSTIDIKLIKKSPAAHPTKPDKYFAALKKAILKTEPAAAVVPMLFPAIADNNYFRSVGIPTYGLLPCELTSEDVSRIHNIDERIPIRAINQGIDIYTELIRQILSNPN